MKLIRGKLNSPSASEFEAVNVLLEIQANPEANDSFASLAALGLKKRRNEMGQKYFNERFLGSTSYICKQLLRKTGNFPSPSGQKTDLGNFESQIFLYINKCPLNVSDVTQILK